LYTVRGIRWNKVSYTAYSLRHTSTTTTSTTPQHGCPASRPAQELVPVDGPTWSEILGLKHYYAAYLTSWFGLIDDVALDGRLSGRAWR